MDKSINSSYITYLFSLYMQKYCKKHSLTTKQFIDLNNKYKILKYIEDCKDYFNECTTREGMSLIEKHIEQQRSQE